MLPIHADFRRRSWTFLSIGFTYYWAITAIFAFGMYKQNLFEFGIIWYSMAYQAEQQSTGLLFSAMITSLHLVKMRFGELQRLWSQSILFKLSMQQDGGQITELFTTENIAIKCDISVWMCIFKELCSLIDLLSETWGVVLIVRMMHDFTLLVSQMYVIYWILTSAQYNLAFVMIVTFWMLQNVIKIFGIPNAARVMITQVCN